jgi:hypothetical protein
MRLPLIAQDDLNPEQRPIYEDMRAGIEKSFQGFKSIAENGALMGPWNPWLHEPKFGKPIWERCSAIGRFITMAGSLRRCPIESRGTVPRRPRRTL